VGSPDIAFNPGGFRYKNGTVKNNSPDKPLPIWMQKEARHGYYGAVSFVDSEIGSVLDELEKLGLAEDTITLLVGDHGWQLGEHGEWHKFTNFELAARVPLIVRVPWKTNSVGKGAPRKHFPRTSQLAKCPARHLPAKMKNSEKTSSELRNLPNFEISRFF